MSPEEVKVAMLTKIADSNLTAKDAQKLGFRASISPPPGISLPGSGFVIPYYTIEGKKNCFYRYRYLPPVQLNGKALRYMQPAGASPEPYFTPLIDWLAYLSTHVGEERVIIITEGELKACCAGKLGLPVIGLGGVWNFKSRKESFIGGLKRISWEGATVYIVYDSDAVSNYQVMQAENELARILLDEKARVFIVRLPPLSPDKKTGLDDFLVARGEEEFHKLLAATEPWAAGRQLHELNEEVVFVHDPGAVLELASMQRMSPSVFTNSVYANRIWEEIVTSAKGKPKVTRKSAATEWLKWPGRGEVRRTTYSPGQAKILETREVNTWKGWGTIPKPGSVKLWHQFLNIVFLGAPKEEQQWFETWLAYPIKYPGTKLYSAVVFHSLTQGAGKTLVGHTMKEIYGMNFSEIGEEELLGNFNDWAENKQFVMGEEITGGDKRSSNDKLKAVITRPTIRINAKFIPAYTLPDCINYYFTSNHPDSFFLEDDDRRYFVHELRGGKLPLNFAAEYDRWYHSPEGSGALMYYFQNFDTAGFNPKAPAMDTSAKRQMMDAGRSEAGAWVAALRDNPEQALRLGPSGPPITFSMMTTDALFRIYESHNGSSSKLTKQGLSRALKYGGFRTVNLGEPVRTKDGVMRLWAVQGERTKLEFAPPHIITKIYDDERKAKF